MYYDSILIRKLTSLEISDLKEELANNDSLWTNHIYDLKYTALKEGKSIHLQWTDDDLNIIQKKWKLFQKTKNILKSILGDNKIGRVYWHRLLPGDKINAHTDVYIPFVKSNKLKNRYQIYLEIDNDVEIFFDNRIIDGLKISNSIINFPLKSMHYYRNNGNSTVYLLVFDDIGLPQSII
jgi:hypothetical protein